MIKEDIRKIVEECNSKIKVNLDEISNIKKTERYTQDYKNKKIAPLKQEIRELKIDTKKKMEDIFNNKINGIKSKEVFNFGDVETSNILKMLEMGISSMQKDELQFLVDKYSDNPVIYRALESQIKKHNIKGVKQPFKTFMPDTKELESKRDSMCNSINMEGDSLFKGLTYDMIMANDDTF